jgi:pimeloyl-ACP methyl ester carboxylesterase
MMGSSAPGVIILNAGVLHRVGPHRLHVVLARRLAAAGTTGLRLDLGGIGDSTASSDATSFRESAVADTRTAMAGLTDRLGIARFVIFGICAGADNAIATALVDERVTGIVLVDPPTYATARSQLRHLRTSVAKRGSRREAARWAFRVVERRLRSVVARFARPDDDPPSGGREMPPVDTYRAQLTKLVDRGVRILAIFSGIHQANYNHPDQLFEICPALRGRIDVAYFPAANHTFTELAAQAKLIDTVTHWMAKHHG